jgi:hypothetical protein
VTGGNKTCLGRCGQPDKAWTVRCYYRKHIYIYIYI